MNKKNKTKKWKAEFHENVLRKLEDVPDDVAEEFEKFVVGLKKGEINPKEIGHPVEWEELSIKLRCPSCRAYKVEWLLEKNSNEVTFHCLSCSESFWMTYEEYKNAIKKNQDCII